MGSLVGCPSSSRGSQPDRLRGSLVVQCTPPVGSQASDYDIGHLLEPFILVFLYQLEVITPDDRSGSMTSFRRTQSQNRFLEGRVCFKILARINEVSIRDGLTKEDGKNTFSRHVDGWSTSF